MAGEVAHLPLETAPIDGSTHVLEIYVQGFDEPLVVVADPAGAPDASGAFPLRLSPLDEEHAAVLRRELFGAAESQDDLSLASGSARERVIRSRTSAFRPPIQAVSNGTRSGIELHHVGKISSRANKKLKSSLQNFESNNSDTRTTEPIAIRPACSRISRGGGWNSTLPD